MSNDPFFDEEKALEQNVYNLNEEEWMNITASLTEELYAIPEWYNKLAECHIKCSYELPGELARDIWILCSDEEVSEIYERARREREAAGNSAETEGS